MKYCTAFLIFGVLFVSHVSAQETPALPPPYPIQKQAISKGGVVVTAHPVPTTVGVNILRKGGNAVDAMVAVHFALAVVYQRAGNIGGGGFMLYRDKQGKTVSLDFRETAPALATRDMYLNPQGQAVDSLSRDGVLAVGVPGSVAGMWEAHQKYGKMAWADLLTPAIELAENGFKLTNWEANTLNEFAPLFKKVNRFQTAFQRDSSKGEIPFKIGDVVVQKDLANTLRRIQKKGRDGFYKGETARLLVAEMQAQKGLISLQDLENYRPKWRTPLSFSYQKYKIISMPPPSSGGILLAQMFGMLEKHPIAAWGFQTVRSIHLMTEIQRRAFADRSVHIADSDFYPVPLKTLTSKTYARSRIADFNPKKASQSSQIKAGEIPSESEETTHYSIVDKQGNAIAVTTTVNTNYGSKVVVKGAGFILNNEMDDFSAKAGVANAFGLTGGKANSIEPNKRMLSSMTPTIVEEKGKLRMLLGSPGGSTIPNTVFQVLLNVLVFKKSLPDAVNAGRIHHQYLPDKIQPEEGVIAPKNLKLLRKMGHTVEERKTMGQVEAILILPNGQKQGVADRRADDTAAGE